MFGSRSNLRKKTDFEENFIFFSSLFDSNMQHCVQLFSEKKIKEL